MVRGSGSPISTFRCRSLSAPFHALGELYFPYAKVDLREIVDRNEILRDFWLGLRWCGFGGSADESCLAILFDFFHFLHFLNGGFRIETRKYARDRTDCVSDPATRPSRANPFEVHSSGEVSPS